MYSRSFTSGWGRVASRAHESVRFPYSNINISSENTNNISNENNDLRNTIGNCFFLEL